MKPNIRWGAVEYNGVQFVVISYRRPPANPGLTARRDFFGQQTVGTDRGKQPTACHGALDKPPADWLGCGCCPAGA